MSGRRKRSREPDPISEAANIPESTVEACVNCAHGTPNEMGSIQCPHQDEPMGKADRCGEFGAKGQGGEAAAESHIEETAEPERPGHWSCGDCERFLDDLKCAVDHFADEGLTGEHVVCDDFVPALNPTGELCATCQNVTAQHENMLECAITEDYQLSYEICGDYTSPEEKERSLSGRDLSCETPSANPTTDFNLYRLPHFDSELNYALNRVFKYLNEPGSGDPSVNIKLKFSEGSVKPTMEIDLPNKIKRSLDATTVVRENGTIRMELPAQKGLFEEEVARELGAVMITEMEDELINNPEAPRLALDDNDGAIVDAEFDADHDASTETLEEIEQVTELQGGAA